jgi:hypothetical protein
VSYSLLLWEQTDLAHEGLADVLTSVPGWTRLDAVRALRRCRGILCEKLTLETAQRIGAVLQDRGIRVFLMRAEEMIPVPTPWPSHNADCLEQGLQIIESDGASRRVGWDQVSGVFVGQLRRTGRKREVHVKPGHYVGTSAAPIAGSNTEVRYRSVKQTVDLCDVVVPSTPERLRFERTALNYDYLGDRLRQDTLANFSTFIGDLLRFAPHAVRNQGVDLYLSGCRDRRLLYDDEPSFVDEIRWLLNRAAVAPEN